jgi:hypothetical protein
MIGSAAIPAIAEYIAEDSHRDWARITAIGCLEKIGTMHPDSRDTCVAIFTRRLKLCEQDDPTVNAFVISSLIDMRALEAAPAIERAFAADCVDLSIAGDWDDVQIALGLKSPVEKHQRRYSPLFGTTAQSMTEERAGSPGLSSSEPARKRNVANKKVKQKMAKQSRKKNRRRK